MEIFILYNFAIPVTSAVAAVPLAMSRVDRVSSCLSGNVSGNSRHWYLVQVHTCINAWIG